MHQRSEGIIERVERGERKMSDEYIIAIRVLREHPSAKGVVEVYSTLLGTHWVYLKELIDAHESARSPVRVIPKNVGRRDNNIHF